MVSLTRPQRTTLQSPALLSASWAVALLTSALPTILWRELTGAVPNWLLWARVGLLGALLLATSVRHSARPLRPYVGFLLVLVLAEALAAWLGRKPRWQHWFGGAAPFIVGLLGVQLLRLAGAGIMLTALWAVHRRRSSFFLTLGHSDAPAAPVRWLGMTRPTSWRRFGVILTVCISGGTLAFLLLAGRPSPAALRQALPLLPFVLIFAALNAFSEELSYRAAFLALLPRVVGAQQALLITAVFFGLGHFYGVPYGAVGVVMAGCLGWLLGKSMLETGGFFWAWFIHFWQDVLIFTFLALGSVVVGGG